MSTFEDHNWEEHWREEVGNYAPQPTTSDWAGMEELLEGPPPAAGQRVVDHEPLPTDPTKVLPRAFSQFPWFGWLLVLATVVSLGYWLGTYQNGVISQEMDRTLSNTDSLPPGSPNLKFPPNYRVRTYWTYDQEGNRAEAATNDTIYFGQRIRRQATRNFLRPDQVYVDTVYLMDQAGNLSVRYDTVLGNGRSLRQVPTGRKSTQEHRELPVRPGGTSFSPPPPALFPSSAPAFAPKPPAVASPNLPVELSIRPDLIVPLPPWQPVLGADYWQRRAEELLESGQLKVQRIPLENGHFPAIRQRF